VWPLSAIAQNTDVNWHAYTTAVIREQHVGNLFLLVPLDPLTPGIRDFYPIGLHLVMALASTGQESVATTINATQFLRGHWSPRWASSR
jgi:hypothetical protein